MTRVNLNDCTPTTPLSTEERQHEIIRELVTERDRLRSKLSASEAECERLRREVEDVAKWLWRQSQLDDTRIREAGYMQDAGDKLRAAVEYLDKKEKADE